MPKIIELLDYYSPQYDKHIANIRWGWIAGFFVSLGVGVSINLDKNPLFRLVTTLSLINCGIQVFVCQKRLEEHTPYRNTVKEVAIDKFVYRTSQEVATSMYLTEEHIKNTYLPTNSNQSENPHPQQIKESQSNNNNNDNDNRIENNESQFNENLDTDEYMVYKDGDVEYIINPNMADPDIMDMEVTPEKYFTRKRNEKLQFYNWQQAKTEAAGFLICGNTGAAKTTTAIWLCGLLTEDEPKQVIVIDVHAYKNYWHEYGLPVVSVQEDCILTILLLLEELNQRKKGKEGEPIIIILDEKGALTINCKNKKEKEIIENAIQLLGSEGRKFDMLFVGINQSQNAEQWCKDKDLLYNYFLILLNSSARNRTNRIGWKQDDPRSIHLNETPYCCLIDGCVSPQLAKHPTHGEYDYFKMKGMKPLTMIKPMIKKPVVQGLNKILERQPIFNTSKNEDKKNNDLVTQKENKRNISIPNNNDAIDVNIVESEDNYDDSQQYFNTNEYNDIDEFHDTSKDGEDKKTDTELVNLIKKYSVTKYPKGLFYQRLGETNIKIFALLKQNELSKTDIIKICFGNVSQNNSINALNSITQYDLLYYRLNYEYNKQESINEFCLSNSSVCWDDRLLLPTEPGVYFFYKKNESDKCDLYYIGVTKRGKNGKDTSIKLRINSQRYKHQHFDEMDSLNSQYPNEIFIGRIIISDVKERIEVESQLIQIYKPIWQNVQF